MTEDAEQAQAQDLGVCVWSLAFKAAGTSGNVRGSPEACYELVTQLGTGCCS